MLLLPSGLFNAILFPGDGLLCTGQVRSRHELHIVSLGLNGVALHLRHNLIIILMHGGGLGAHSGDQLQALMRLFCLGCCLARRMSKVAAILVLRRVDFGALDRVTVAVLAVERVVLARQAVSLLGRLLTAGSTIGFYARAANYHHFAVALLLEEERLVLIGASSTSSCSDH